MLFGLFREMMVVGRVGDGDGWMMMLSAVVSAALVLFKERLFVVVVVVAMCVREKTVTVRVCYHR